jgi:glycosyltransferase involved in cell wall biosynthesis
MSSSELSAAWLADDTRWRRRKDVAWLVARHPIGCLRDLAARRRWRREEQPASLRLLAPAARRVARFKTDHIHAHFAAGAALHAQRIARLLGVTHSVATHGYDVFRSPRNLREKVEQATFTVAMCQHFALYLRAIAPRARVEVMAAGVDGSTFRRSRPLPGGRIVVAVGRLVEKKGFEYLVRAAALLEDVEVWIVGDGELREELKDLARMLRVDDSVKFVGAKHNVAPLLEEADLLVLPCVVARDGDRDSTPVVIKEALAMELPVVATDAGGVAEAVHPPWGIIVPPRDSVALAEAIERMLGEPVERRAELGRQARGWVLEHASLKHESARLSGLIAEATGSSGR